MKFKASIGDAVELPPDSYLVVRQKGQGVQHTQLIHVSEAMQHVLIDLPGRPQALFYALALRLQFDHIVPMTIEEMVVMLKVSAKQVYEILKRLKDAGLVKKVGKDRYKLNPFYVWRGRLGERKKALEEWTP